MISLLAKLTISLLVRFALAQEFSPSEAAAGWNNVFNAAPDAAGAVYGFCTSIQLSNQFCADAFLSDKPQLSYATRQAAINCMSQMKTTQAQTQALMGALNVDTTKFSKYASGNVAPPKWERRNGEWVKKDASPADVKRATAKGRAEGEVLGKAVYQTLSFILDVNVEVLNEALAKRYPSSEKVLDKDPIGKIASALMPDEDSFVEGFADAGAVDGATHPLDYVEPTGSCVRTKMECQDADGNPYINTDYHPDPIGGPATPGGFDGLDTGADTNPIPTGVQDEFVTPIEGEVTTAIQTPPNVHIDPDAPSGSENFMNRCIKEESQVITKQIGTTKTVNDAGSGGARTEEEKAQDAQRQLRLGVCDTKYWGEPKCQKWKTDLESTPVDSELRFQMQSLGTQTRLCGSLAAQFRSCEQGYKEIRKRYVLDDDLDLAVSSTFNPLKAKVGKLVPIRFSNPDGSAPKYVAAGGANDDFASSMTFRHPSQPTTTTRKPTVFTMTDEFGRTTTIRDGTSKPTSNKETSTRKPFKVKPITYVDAAGSTIIVTPEQPGEPSTTGYHGAPASKPLTVIGEDGKRTTIKWDGGKTSKFRTPIRTPKVPPTPKGPSRDEL